MFICSEILDAFRLHVLPFSDGSQCEEANLLYINCIKQSVKYIQKLLQSVKRAECDDWFNV